MKKKTKKNEPDFFTHAKKVLSKESYLKALKKGQTKVHELRLEAARLMNK